MESRFEARRLLGAKKAEAETAAKEHEKILYLKDDAIQVVRRVRGAIEVSRELDSHMKELCDEFRVYSNMRIEKVFRSVRPAASEWRILHSQWDRANKSDLAMATEVFNDVQDDNVVLPSSPTGSDPSGARGEGDAMFSGNEDDAMCQDMEGLFR